MWRNGARRSCETEYEKASSSRLRPLQLVAQRGQLLRLPQHDPDDGVAELGGGIELALPPGERPARTVSFQVSKLLRGWSRRCPSAGPIGFVRVAAPLDRPHDLGAEPEDVARGRASRSRSPAGRWPGRRRRSASGKTLAQRSVREDVLGGPAEQPVGEPADVGSSGVRRPAGRQLAVERTAAPAAAAMRQQRRRVLQPARRRSCSSSAMRPRRLRLHRLRAACAARRRRGARARRAAARGSGRGSRRRSAPRTGPAAASAWWHEIRPQSPPSRRIEIDIDAPVPMFRM